MTQYILRRLVLLPIVLFGVSVLVFMVLHLVPGDSARVIAGPDAPPETIAAIEHALGLDRPIDEQYALSLGRALNGDLGAGRRHSFSNCSFLRRASTRTRPGIFAASRVSRA